jgi:ribosome-associated translation inhibitor RaiA
MVMKTPLRITFHQMPTSPAAEADVRAWVADLEEDFDRIVDCQVLIELPHKHHHQGGLYHVRIDLHVPGKHIVAGQAKEDRAEHAELSIALRDAFRAARAQLEAHAGRSESAARPHETNA